MRDVEYKNLTHMCVQGASMPKIDEQTIENTDFTYV